MPSRKAKKIMKKPVKRNVDDNSFEKKKRKRKSEIDVLYENLEFIFFEENTVEKKIKETIASRHLQQKHCESKDEIYGKRKHTDLSKNTLQSRNTKSNFKVSRVSKTNNEILFSQKKLTKKLKIDFSLQESDNDSNVTDKSTTEIDVTGTSNQKNGVSIDTSDSTSIDNSSYTSDISSDTTEVSIRTEDSMSSETSSESNDSIATQPYNEEVASEFDSETLQEYLYFNDQSKVDPVVIGEKLDVGSLVIVRLQIFGWWFGKIIRIKTVRCSKPYIVEVRWFGDQTVMEVPMYCIENYKVFPEAYSEKKMRKKYYKIAVEEFLLELFKAFGGDEERLHEFSLNVGTSLSYVLIQWGLNGLDVMSDSFEKHNPDSKQGNNNQTSSQRDELDFSDTEISLPSSNSSTTSTPCKTRKQIFIAARKSSSSGRQVLITTSFASNSCKGSSHKNKNSDTLTSNQLSLERHSTTSIARRCSLEAKTFAKIKNKESRNTATLASHSEDSSEDSITRDVENIRKAIREKENDRGVSTEKSRSEYMNIRNLSFDSSSSDKSSNQSEFKNGDIVIGKLRGFDWWFGKVISHKKARKPPPNLGFHWVKWYGDHKISMLPSERLEDLSSFPTRVLVRKMKGIYLKAVCEVLEEAAKCCNKTFPSDKDERLKSMIDWAMDGFYPENVKRFCVEEEDIVDEESDDDEEEDRQTNHFAPDLSVEVKALFDEVLQGSRSIEKLCLGCGDEKVKCGHPLFCGGLCKECKESFMESVYLFDEEGFQMYCCICGDGQHIISCNANTCKRSFCSICLEMFCGNGYMNRLASMELWDCFLCSGVSTKLLKPRENWQDLLNQLFKEDLESVDYGEVIFYNPVPIDERKPIRVLALFDGIATGLYVLKELDFKIDLYMAAEIDDHAIKVSKVRHGSSIHHIGDVRSIQRKDIENHGPFDLVLGGSPCNDLSIANPARKGIYDGTGVLFFEFFRILNYALPNPLESRPFFWLFENVVGMRYSDRETISRFLSCHPVVISAKDVSAQYRCRYFWGNLPGMGRSLNPLSNDKLKLQDCLERDCGREAKFDKVRCITTKSNSVKQTRHLVLPVTMDKKDDNLWITEIERLFGFPEHYTDVANMGRTHRQKLLGKAWSVPVIRHLLTPLKDYFETNN